MSVAGRVAQERTSFPGLTLGLSLAIVLLFSRSALAQLTDVTQTDTVNAGINKSFAEEANPGLPGDGRGSVSTPGSSLFIISRDPFRAIRRGQQIFQRKFTRNEGQGPRINNSSTGDLNDPAQSTLGGGLSDSCAGCHSRPRDSAGFGGDEATRPDSRNTPHLFGVGLREMIADEITRDLRATRSTALAQAKSSGQPVTVSLNSKGINFGTIRALPEGTVDVSGLQGVTPDLRIKPFAAEGRSFSIREFLISAFKEEMGLEAVDPDLLAASHGGRVVTPAGMVLDGSLDFFPPPPVASPFQDGDGDGVVNEIPVSIVDFEEFFLLNSFPPATYRPTPVTAGLEEFKAIGCAGCHVQNLQIRHDRRVANVRTAYDETQGIFNRLFATFTNQSLTMDDGSGFPLLRPPAGKPFLVRNIFTDFKFHFLGPKFVELNYDGTFQRMFMTRPLWGVGSAAALGHDGRSINLREVILRHGGEAQSARDSFALLSPQAQAEIEEFLRSLVLFPPNDTASTLDPGNRNSPHFPQEGHGSIRLTVLFNDPTDVE
jgi:Di-haem oxidoreductase, putative peroxidase